MKAAAYEYWLSIHDSENRRGSDLLGHDEQTAHEMVKRVLDQFVCEGYVIFRSFAVPNVWVAQRQAEYAMLELIVTSVN